jgi:hypothetical protein
MHISFKIIKFLFHFMLLDMFRTPLCPSSGASYCCTCSLWSPCGIGSVVSSSLVLLLLLRKHVSIIMSFLLLHMQSLVTVWCWVGCFLQPCSVVTAAFAYAFVCLCMTTLTEVFPCLFLSCKANARVKPARTGHGSHSS